MASKTGNLISFLSLHIGLKVKITKKLLPPAIVQIVAGNRNGQVSFVWSWHLFRRICLTSGNRGTAGVGDSVVLVRSWTWPKSVMVVYRATAGGAVLAVLLSSSQDVLQPSAMVERSPCSFCNLKMIWFCWTDQQEPFLFSFLFGLFRCLIHSLLNCLHQDSVSITHKMIRQLQLCLVWLVCSGRWWLRRDAALQHQCRGGIERAWCHYRMFQHVSDTFWFVDPYILSCCIDACDSQHKTFHVWYVRLAWFPCLGRRCLPRATALWRQCCCRGEKTDPEQ